MQDKNIIMSDIVTTDNNKLNEFTGLAISSGKVVAQVCVYTQKRHAKVKSLVLETEEDVNVDINRFENALAACSDKLDIIADSVAKKIGENEKEIIIAQKHILNDPKIIAEIKSRITKERKNVEYILSEVFNEYEEKFLNLDNEYLQERSSDIREIKKHLLDYLTYNRPGFDCKGQEDCTKGVERIVIAEELTVAMTVNMNLNNIRGIVTEHGGYSSHSAILARSIGVPAVSGIHGIYKKIRCGDTVLLDGDNGRVLVEPDETAIKKIITKDPFYPENACILSTPRGMEVFANVSMLEGVQHALSVKTDGIGLFRTEIAFIQKGRLLTENEQYEFYAKVLQLMEGRPTTFRLLDVGGDKELPLFKMAKEENSFLGMRGARFLLRNYEIFSTQVKALLRLSKLEKVHILFPMIVDLVQLDKLLRAIREMLLTVDANKENIKFGAMFEVPSACIQADAIFKMVDFASIGSNDLIQYLFAVDRNNESVSQCYNPEHPALWDVLKNLSNAAKNAGKPLSICGEMAGRENIVTRLLNIGITSLSVSPRLIHQVRNEMVEYASKK